MPDSRESTLSLLESADGHRSYVSSSARGYEPSLFRELASFYQRDFLAVTPDDLYSENLPNGQPGTTTNISADFDFVSQAFFARNGIDAIAWRNPSSVTVERLPYFDRNNYSAVVDAQLQKDGRLLNTITLADPDEQVSDLLPSIANMSSLENSSLIANLDPYTVRAFILAHEAGHFDEEGHFKGKSYAEAEGDDFLGAEAHSDRRAFAFCDYLKSRGYPIDERTLTSIRDFRSLALLQLPEIDRAGEPPSTKEQISNYFSASEIEVHATGPFISGEENPNISLEDSFDRAPELTLEIYQMIGRSYRANYDVLMSEDPELAGLRNDTRALVNAHRPFQAIIDDKAVYGTSGNENEFAEQNLGWRISQAYPDIHYAFVKGLLAQGEELSDDNDLALLRQYAGAFERQLGDTVDTGLVIEITAQVDRAVNGLEVASPKVAPPTASLSQAIAPLQRSRLNLSA